ncbi:CAP domain-containing protein [Nonomuraea sp. NPDC046802]|uniref:CAP domain-containing protein n=1 Tax=Nonomuraea sp. NPDC046802 TaxID=3154919 RepID=UPI0033F7818A
MPAAQASADSNQACKVIAGKPVATGGMVRGTATRTGCADRATLRVRVMVAVSGADRAVKSGSRTVRNGRVTAGVTCAAAPRRYYVVALDSKGRSSKSRPVKLTCEFASQIEEEVVKIVNRARTKQGCRPLAHDPRLHLAAERHSADMARTNRLTHDSSDGTSFDRRIRAAGFSFTKSAENIAQGQRTAAAVVDAWLGSPPLRKTIMNCSYTHTGVGQNTKGLTWTQVFATP